MRRSVIGIALAGLLVGLLWLTVSAQPLSDAQSSPTPEVSSGQAAQLVMTATVGIAPGACAITDTVQVRADTLVYYCYAISYTGTQPVALHRIETARQGVITDSLARIVQPGETINTVGLGLVITDVTAVDVTNAVTWTVRTAANIDPPFSITAVDATSIDIVTPDITLFKTVGQDSLGCPTTQNFRVPSGSTVYYCLTLINRGDVTLSRHTIVDTDPFLNVNGAIVRALPPGDRFVITSQTLGTFGLSGTLTRGNVTAPITSSVSATSETDLGLTASSVATAVVDVGLTTVLFTKTISFDPTSCGADASILAPPGTQLYYCASIRNTGQVPIVRHTLTEQNLSIDLRFDYRLMPGEVLVITDAVLRDVLDQPRVFGPLDFIPQYATVVNNTMFYSGISEDGFAVSASSATFASFIPTAIPTETPTPRPRPTSTPTFTPLPTETFTPSPPPDTPTPTETATPTETPTATRDWAASFVATPTPSQFIPEGQPFDPNAPVEATPFVENPFAGNGEAPPEDPVSVQLTAIAAAETEIAATATALAPPTDTPDLGVPGPDAPEPDTPEPTDDGMGPAVDDSDTGTPVGDLPPTETPTETPTGTPTETPTAEIAVVVVTNTPSALELAQRPVILPTPTPTADMLLLAAMSFDTVAAAAGWLWFLGGSLIFFVTAGIVAGLFFYTRDRERFALVTDEEEQWDDARSAEEWPDEERFAPPRREPTARPRTRPTEDWPADLP